MVSEIQLWVFGVEGQVSEKGKIRIGGSMDSAEQLAVADMFKPWRRVAFPSSSFFPVSLTYFLCSCLYLRLLDFHNLLK